MELYTGLEIANRHTAGQDDLSNNLLVTESLQIFERPKIVTVPTFLALQNIASQIILLKSDLASHASSKFGGRLSLDPPLF